MSAFIMPRHEPRPPQNLVSVNVVEARRITHLAYTNVTCLRDEIEQQEMKAERERRYAWNSTFLARLLPFLRMKTTDEAVQAACPSLNPNSGANARLEYLILQGTARVANGMLEKWRDLDDTANVPIKKLEWKRMIDYSGKRKDCAARQQFDM
jgi:hypothetical protein